MDETAIINKAIEKLKAHTGFHVDWKPLSYGVDGQMELDTPQGKLIFFLEVKNELREYQLPGILYTAIHYPPLMVIGNRIFPKIKETLRKNKIAWLDGAGNIYFDTNNQLVWLDGNKPEEEVKPQTNRAFTKTGLKALFYILGHQDAINFPYRLLAEKTGVAIGNIKNILDGLKEGGYILPVTKKEIKLKNKKQLLDRWVAGYRETLKPTLLVGTYRFWNAEDILNWRNLPLWHAETVWGGEPAASELTNNMRPEILTVYTNENASRFMVTWKLIPDAQGNVSLYKKFWKDNHSQTGHFAPPLLVYADLLLTDDPRCMEAANIIYQKFLEHGFEDD